MGVSDFKLSYLSKQALTSKIEAYGLFVYIKIELYGFTAIALLFVMTPCYDAKNQNKKKLRYQQNSIQNFKADTTHFID